LSIFRVNSANPNISRNGFNPSEFKKIGRVYSERLWSIRCIDTSLSVSFVTNVAQDFPLQEKHQKTLIILTDPLGELKRSPIPPSRKKGREGEFGPEGMGREEDRKELGVGRNRGS